MPDDDVRHQTAGPRRVVIDPKRVAWTISAAATAAWLLAVVLSGTVSRVVEHWEAAVTMLFGSFLAGSSPEGGGAVAFPVFTKVLDVPGPIARTFGLSIQAVGMSMAIISIVLHRRPFHVRATMLGSIAAVVGFVVSVSVWGDPNEVFWPIAIGTPWVKATFSIVLATTSFLMVRHIRAGSVAHQQFRWTRRFDVGVVVAGLAGGVLSSLTGTGANILLFLFLVVVVNIDPKVALVTALAAMTAVSIVGLVLLGLVDQQLNVVVEAGRVISVGDFGTDLAASEADLLGMWLAAIPVVVWGAPLGAWVAARVEEHQLVGFVAVLAAVEVVTTMLLVPELRTETPLLIYLASGLLLFPALMVGLQRSRIQVFGTEAV